MLKVKGSTASQEQEQDKSMHAIVDYQITHMHGGSDTAWSPRFGKTLCPGPLSYMCVITQRA